MRQKRRWLRVVFLFAGIGVAYGLGCYLLAIKYIRPGVRNDAPPPKGFYESKDHLQWQTASLSDRPAVYVLVHGYGGNQSGWSDVATRLAERGFGVVVPALPGHDNRTRESSGFAVRESKIVREAVSYVREQSGPEAKIVLVGISMGGAACWLASDGNAEVHAVATEGTFARLAPATKAWFERKAPGSSVYLSPVVWMARGMTGIDPADVNPVEAAANWKGRSLLIHGDQDSLFPISDSEELAKASGGELWVVSGAPHAQCSNQNIEEYVARLASLAENR